MQGRNCHRIAFCGIIAALGTAIILLGSVLPLATFCAPALAGLLLLPAALEYGIKTGLLAYLTTGILCLMLVPDVEMTAMFLFLLGYYPMVREKMDLLHPVPLRWLCKLVLFNGAVVAAYLVLIFLLGVPGLTQDLAVGGARMVAILLVLGNITFVVYDFAITSLRVVYVTVLRSRLQRFL